MADRHDDDIYKENQPDLKSRVERLEYRRSIEKDMKKAKNKSFPLTLISGVVAILAIWLVTQYLFTGTDLNRSESSASTHELEENNDLDETKEQTEEITFEETNQGDTSTKNEGQMEIIEHKVVEGETLADIALHYYESDVYSVFLARYNGIGNDTSIKVGDIIKVKFPPAYEQDDHGERKDVKHIVQLGDSLYKISLKYYDTPKYQNFLAQYNQIRDVSTIKIGDELIIPAEPREVTIATSTTSKEEQNVVETSSNEQSDSDSSSETVQTHTIEKGDTLYKISLQYYESSEYQDYIAEVNGIRNPDDLKIGIEIKIPPKPRSE
jgi:nucleoid-associated protein YgaU